VACDPQVYLTDVLTKPVNLWPASRLDELLPWA
jgi:transposase